MIFRGKFSWTFPEGQHAEWDQSFEKKPPRDGEQIVCPSLKGVPQRDFFFLIINNRCVLWKVWKIQKDKKNHIEIVHDSTERSTFKIWRFYFLKIWLYLCVYQNCSEAALITFWAGDWLLCCEGCPEWTSVSWGLRDAQQLEHLCLYPLDASGTFSSPSPQLWQLKMSPDIARCPWGGKLPRLRRTGVYLYVFAFFTQLWPVLLTG